LSERDALGEFDRMFEARDWSRGSTGIQVVPERGRCEEDGAREVAIDAISVGVPIVARIVGFPHGARASEEPEEAAVAVQCHRHPVGIARLCGCFRDRSPDRGIGIRAGDLDPEPKV
jgi:hypothetical protein